MTDRAFGVERQPGKCGQKHSGNGDKQYLVAFLRALWREAGFGRIARLGQCCAS